MTDFYSQPKQRAALHADLAKYISSSHSHRGPEGALREIDTHLQRQNPTFTRGECDVFVQLESLFSQRTLAAGTGSTGGYLVNTEILSPIERVLRAVLVLVRAGAQVVTGLRSNAEIPAQTASNSFAWLAESDVATLSDETLGQIAVTPKRLSGGAVYTRQLATQAPAIQEQQFDSLARDAMAAFELGAFQGTGGPQPLGIFNAPVANSVTFSSTATLTQLTSYERKLGDAHVDSPTISFVADPATREKFRGITRSTNASTYLWNDGPNGVLGYPSFVTKNCPSSSLVAGDFSKVSLNFFGDDGPIVRLTVDPYSSKRQEKIEVTATLLGDVALRNLNAFCINSGSTTQ